MSIVPASVKCDGCGKNRVEDSNHWRSLRPDYDNLYVANHIVDPEDKQGIWSHACGETCALKLFSHWLATGKLDE